jgi:hypothetical protein
MHGLLTIAGLIGLAAVAWTPAHAQTTMTYRNFANVSALTFAGNATGPVTVNSVQTLRLVPAMEYQSGAAYLTTPITLGQGGAFSTTFQFRVKGTTSADWSDGMTFVLAASPAGLGSPGATGSSLGYQGVPNSLAVEYDTYYGGNDKLPNEVAVTTDGNTTTIDNPAGSAGEPYGVSQCETYGPSQRGCLSDGKLWTTMITYDGEYMNVKVQDGGNPPFQVITNYKIDLRKALGTATVYAGFTGGTGEDYANFYIYDWKLTY